MTVPLTTQPTAAHAAASALALHWYTQEASVEPPPEYVNLGEVWEWLYCAWAAGGVQMYVHRNTTREEE